MEPIVKAAWIAIAAIHLIPSLPVFQPAMIGRLYRIEPSGALGVLLAHRAFLFLAVLAVSIFAAFDPASRKAATLVAALSMMGFLWLYMRAGMPAGALRTIALVDLVGLVPLVVAASAEFNNTS